MAHVEFLDQTLRDGQQSLWGMRLQAGMALPAADWLDRTGFRVCDLTGSNHFEVLIRHRLIEIRQGNAIVRPAQAGNNKNRAIPADTVVLVTHNEPNRGLFDELRDEMDCHLIGDARSPRDVQVAIAEGHRVARGLLG